MLGFTSDINLVKVELPDSLEEICDGATFNVLRYEWNAGGKIGLAKYSLRIFSSTGLSEISLPAAIRKIGNYAFIACLYLSEVYCDSLNPPILGDNVFGNSVKNIFVPSESVDLYKSALGWKIIFRFNQSTIVGVVLFFERFPLHKEVVPAFFMVNHLNIYVVICVPGGIGATLETLIWYVGMRPWYIS